MPDPPPAVPPGLTLRDAVEADLGAICEMIHELAEYEHMSDEVVLDEEQVRHDLFGPEPAARVLVAAHDGEVAGFALWFPTYSTFLGRPGIWLEDLFVRPPHRGLGIGTTLLRSLRERTDGRVEWSVLDWNQPAIDLYEGLGARPLDEWTTYRWGPDPG